MSSYSIGQRDEWGWELIRRTGLVEMWHSEESGNYGVYLYEQENTNVWLVHAIRGSRDAADNSFYGVVSLVMGLPTTGWVQRVAGLLDLCRMYKSGEITNDELAEEVADL